MNELLISVLMIAAGLFLLAKGGGWLIDGATSLARRLGIAPIVIGLTVVAFGTSAPELFVNLTAAAYGRSGIAFGNVIGSNIANILLVLGIGAILTPIRVKRATVWKEVPLALLAALLVWIMVSDSLLTGRLPDQLDRIDGLVLLSFLIIFLYYTFGISKIDAPKPDIEKRSLKSSWLYIAIGLIALVFGGNFTVDGANTLGRLAGIPEAFIGLTVVAIGTSLPELAATVAAARRGQADIIVGNAVGSNIFNIFWILGLSAVVSPIPVDPVSGYDALVATAVMLLLFVAMYTGRRQELEKWQGWGFLILYVVGMTARFFVR